MVARIALLLDRVRRPEYTRENRCVPCTVLNVVLALLTSALVAFASPGLAAVAFLGSVLAIYLRGYLVPGTPTITKRYLPDRVLAMSDSHPSADRKPDEDAWGPSRNSRTAGETRSIPNGSSSTWVRSARANTRTTSV